MRSATPRWFPATIAVFKRPSTVYSALMVERNGVLNIASLDATKGWRGLDTLGNVS